MRPLAAGDKTCDDVRMRIVETEAKPVWAELPLGTAFRRLGSYYLKMGNEQGHLPPQGYVDLRTGAFFSGAPDQCILLPNATFQTGDRE